MLGKDDEIRILQSIGELIRHLRESKEMSQHDLSIEADIPKNQIGRIERAEINTTVITLHKIASALNVDVASLVNPHSNQT
ncbi:helix-turn-helix transcriptional regulator [Flagellimonas chongwuensis]|nr:helix-turn-helix transcriptional regulator [Allomuricauda chongwuensis]